jgi:hypothetical protein
LSNIRNALVIPALTLLLHIALLTDASAQRVFVGGGVGAARVPRAQNPLCRSARTLHGANLVAQAGVEVQRLRFTGSYDFVYSGSTSVADCVPRTGIATDSLFADAGHQVSSLAAEAWYAAHPLIGLGAGIGFLPNHESWFLSAGLGTQFRFIRAEAFARRYHASFQEITRDYNQQPVVELSRESHTEASWGWTIRLLLVTR